MRISIYRGDSKTLRVTIEDRNGSVVDTTGWTIRFTVRTEASAVDTLITKTSATPGEVDAVDASAGVWDITLLPADTDLPCETYVYDVQGETPASEIYTALKDEFEILQDVTR